VDHYQFYLFLLRIGANGLLMAYGGFEALSCPPNPKLDTELKISLVGVLPP
jgi:hypothetical protein